MDNKVSADFGEQFTEMKAGRWGQIFYRTQRNVLFGGGEPFLHPKAIEILFAIPFQKKVMLFSNATLITDEHIRALGEWARRSDAAGGWHLIDLAYHPPADADFYIDRALKLREAGVCLGLTAVRDEKTVKLLRQVKCRLQEYGLPFNIRENVFDRADRLMTLPAPREVFCRRRHLVIAPDGRRYPCIRHMLAKTAPMEDMLEEDLQPLEQVHRCRNYGTCTVCDLERFCKIATTEEEVEGSVVRKDFKARE